MRRTIIVVFLVMIAATVVWTGTESGVAQTRQDKKQEIDQLPSPVGGVAALRDLVKYPQSARKDSVQGVVYVEATVDQQGKVIKAIAVKGVREDLDQAALDAVQKVTFKPGLHKGKPVEAIITIPISFKLK